MVSVWPDWLTECMDRCDSTASRRVLADSERAVLRWFGCAGELIVDRRK